MASLIVAFPSETLEMGKALGRAPGAVGHAFVPDVANRFDIYLRLQDAGPVEQPLLNGLVDRYAATIHGNREQNR